MRFYKAFYESDMLPAYPTRLLRFFQKQITIPIAPLGFLRMLQVIIAEIGLITKHQLDFDLFDEFAVMHRLIKKLLILVIPEIL